MCCRLNRFVAGSLLAVVVAVGTLLIERNFSVAQESKPAPVRHVVLFKFKAGTSKEQLEKLVSEFKNLPKKIPGILEFEHGTNNSPEGLNEGLTHAFLVTFKSEKDRDAYLPHEAHKAYVDILLPHLEKAVVVDYSINK